MRFRVMSSGLLAGSLSLAALTGCGGDDEAEKKPPTTPAGGACNLEDKDSENHGCVAGTKCAKPEGETQARCLVQEGGDCDADADEAYCADGLACSEVTSGGHRCYAEVILHGMVRDASDTSPIEDADVMAVNEEGVAVTDVAHTDAMGNYDLAVPTVRNEDGTPASTKFTLRAAAQDYQAFPSGVRVALPIDVEDATLKDRRYVVENALTTVDLIPLESEDRSMISGSIVALEGAGDGDISGVLVVAKGADGAVSGLTDKAGAFTIFNVPAGDYELKAYGAEIQVETKSVSVPAAPLTGVELLQLDQATTTVSGSVQIVNAAGGSMTSVILVVEDTFEPNAARGEVPRGLRAPKTGDPSISGSFSISGVPNGKYVVLAAYENDDLVRDPDTNIAGTDFVHLEVAGTQTMIAISESFKVTQALATISPGADGPEAVTEKPMLTWADDSSEDWYDLRVFDAFGNEVWKSLMIPGASGSDDVSVQYAGPLDPGMYYQFRTSSWRQPGNGDAAPISMTEDLRGVFYLPAE
jgi:hypothetical protein